MLHFLCSGTGNQQFIILSQKQYITFSQQTISMQWCILLGLSGSASAKQVQILIQ